MARLLGRLRLGRLRGLNLADLSLTVAGDTEALLARLNSEVVLATLRAGSPLVRATRVFFGELRATGAVGIGGSSVADIAHHVGSIE
ncbi:MAG: hypothetical protein EBW79_06775 [Actinobacteria bacterium]|nr:hypothetical protein [Actinomycetota bacterium]